eukprot:scaffold7904_cov103-Isochrysis_galbana.AAC.10
MAGGHLDLGKPICGYNSTPPFLPPPSLPPRLSSTDSCQRHPSPSPKTPFPPGKGWRRIGGRRRGRLRRVRVEEAKSGREATDGDLACVQF